jgi:hypothetical protein
MPVGRNNLLQNGATLCRVITRHQIMVYHVTMLSSHSWTVCCEYCFNQSKDVDLLAPKAVLRCFRFHYSCDVSFVVPRYVLP